MKVSPSYYENIITFDQDWLSSYTKKNSIYAKTPFEISCTILIIFFSQYVTYHKWKMTLDDFIIRTFSPHTIVVIVWCSCTPCIVVVNHTVIVGFTLILRKILLYIAYAIAYIFWLTTNGKWHLSPFAFPPLVSISKKCSSRLVANFF